MSNLFRIIIISNHYKPFPRHSQRLFDKDDYRVYYKPYLPWCSAWGICKGHLRTEPEQVAEMQEASALEQEYDNRNWVSKRALPHYQRGTSTHYSTNSTSLSTAHSNSTTLFPHFLVYHIPLLSSSYPTQPPKKKRLFAPVKTDSEVRENGDTIQKINDLSRENYSIG